MTAVPGAWPVTGLAAAYDVVRNLTIMDEA